MSNDQIAYIGRETVDSLMADLNELHQSGDIKAMVASVNLGPIPEDAGWRRKRWYTTLNNAETVYDVRWLCKAVENWMFS